MRVFPTHWVSMCPPYVEFTDHWVVWTRVIQMDVLLVRRGTNQPNVQCGRSSLSQDGGANLRHHFIQKNQTTLNKWMGRPQLLPEIFEIVLRPIWWATGSEQPSPCLHRAAAAQLLTWSGTLLLLMLCISISWLNSVCISLLIKSYFCSRMRVG